MKHRGRFLTLCLLVLVAAVMSAACTEDQPAGPSQLIVINTNTNTQTQGGGTPTATPSPGLTRPDSVGVGFFGGTCPAGSGKVAPGNGGTQLPVGCTGFLTATPKKNGAPMPPEQHGDSIVWSDAAPSGIVTVLPAPNAFNRDLVAQAAGGFAICATVQGVTGCFHGTVTP